MMDDSESEADIPAGEHEPQLGGNIDNIVFLLKAPKNKGWPNLYGADLVQKIRRHFRRVNAESYAKCPRFYMSPLDGRPILRYRFLNHNAAATLLRWLQVAPAGMRNEYAQAKFIKQCLDGHWAYAVDKQLVAEHFLMSLDHEDMLQLLFNYLGKGRSYGQMLYTSDYSATLYNQEDNRMVKRSRPLSMASMAQLNSRKRSQTFALTPQGYYVVAGVTKSAQFALTQVRKQSRLPGNEGHSCQVYTLRRLTLEAHDASTGQLRYRMEPPDFYLLAHQSFAGTPYIMQSPRTSMETKNEFLLKVKMRQAGMPYVPPDSVDALLDAPEDPATALSVHQRHYWKKRLREPDQPRRAPRQRTVKAEPTDGNEGDTKHDAINSSLLTSSDASTSAAQPPASRALGDLADYLMRLVDTNAETAETDGALELPVLDLPVASCSTAIQEGEEPTCSTRSSHMTPQQATTSSTPTPAERKSARLAMKHQLVHSIDETPPVKIVIDEEDDDGSLARGGSSFTNDPTSRNSSIQKSDVLWHDLTELDDFHDDVSSAIESGSIEDDSDSEAETFSSGLDGNLRNIVHLAEPPSLKLYCDEEAGPMLRQAVNKHLTRVNARGYPRVPRFYASSRGRRPLLHSRFVTARSAACVLRWLCLVPDRVRRQFTQPHMLPSVLYGNWAYAVDRTRLESTLGLSLTHVDVVALLAHQFGEAQPFKQRLDSTASGVTLFKQSGAELVQLSGLLTQRATHSTSGSGPWLTSDDNAQPVITGFDPDNVPEFALWQVRRTSRLPGNEGHVFHVFAWRHCVRSDDEGAMRMAEPTLYLVTAQSFGGHAYGLCRRKTAAPKPNGQVNGTAASKRRRRNHQHQTRPSVHQRSMRNPTPLTDGRLAETSSGLDFGHDHQQELDGNEEMVFVEEDAEEDVLVEQHVQVEYEQEWVAADWDDSRQCYVLAQGQMTGDEQQPRRSSHL